MSDSINSRKLDVGDELHDSRYPHMRYWVNAVDDLHIEIRDQLGVGVIYTHAQFREHLVSTTQKVGPGEQREAGWFA